MGLEYERKSREERKEDQKLSEQFGNVGIKNGVQLSNFAVDQFRITELLNRIPTANGGAGPRLANTPRNGFCEPALHQAILNFQRTNNTVLGVIDGWISPHGPTMRLLRTMAEGKGLGAAGGSVEQKTQEILRQLQIVVTLGRQLLQPLNVNSLPPSMRGRLALLVAQLERDLAQASASKGKPEGNLPVQNNILIIGAVIVALIAAAGAILIIFVDPAFRKAAKVSSDGILREIEIRIGEFNRFMFELRFLTFTSVLSGIIAMSNAVDDLKKRISSCGPKFDVFQQVARQLIIALRNQGAQSQLEVLMKAWISALSALMFCLQANDVSPTEIVKLLSILSSPVLSLGITLFDAITKLFLKGFFPPANLLQR
ncbi:MAG: hypothetical protein HY040_02390 [Planctomycetes bacterium]|nr:hypothetical protein [Planctomycetota bacterium]